jgi:ABC-type multidrug transport system fused ATPase/permease subunit
MRSPLFSFREYFLDSPVPRVIRMFMPRHWGALRFVASLGVVASIFNAAGYVLLLPLLDFFTKNQTKIAVGPLVLEPEASTFIMLVGVVVMLLVASLQLNYLVYKQALALLRITAMEAAITGLLALKKEPAATTLDTLPRMTRAAREIVGQVAYACGFSIKQAALGVVDLLQLLVFVAILFWLNPLLTFIFLTISAIAGWYYLRSVRRVSDAVGSAQDMAKRSADVFRELGRNLISEEFSEAGLRNKLVSLCEGGITGELLDKRLDMHRELKRGPLLIEYIYPVALIVLPMVVIATDSFVELAGRLIVYVLILRQSVALLHGIGGLFISINRFYPQLRCFADLVRGAAEPSCFFLGAEVGESLRRKHTR